jgi:hypothetical protein
MVELALSKGVYGTRSVVNGGEFVTSRLPQKGTKSTKEVSSTANDFFCACVPFCGKS